MKRITILTLLISLSALFIRADNHYLTCIQEITEECLEIMAANDCNTPCRTDCEDYVVIFDCADVEYVNSKCATVINIEKCLETTCSCKRRLPVQPANFKEAHPVIANIKIEQPVFITFRTVQQLPVSLFIQHTHIQTLHPTIKTTVLLC